MAEVMVLIYIFGRSYGVNTYIWQKFTCYKENTEALLVASKEIGLAVHADETKYMVMLRDQNAGRSHNITIDNSSFESVEQFEYVGRN
jgi:hypothetical protein